MTIDKEIRKWIKENKNVFYKLNETTQFYQDQLVLTDGRVVDLFYQFDKVTISKSGHVALYGIFMQMEFPNFRDIKRSSFSTRFSSPIKMFTVMQDDLFEDFNILFRIATPDDYFNAAKTVLKTHKEAQNLFSPKANQTDKAAEQ